MLSAYIFKYFYDKTNTIHIIRRCQIGQKNTPFLVMIFVFDVRAIEHSKRSPFSFLASEITPKLSRVRRVDLKKDSKNPPES